MQCHVCGEEGAPDVPVSSRIAPVSLYYCARCNAESAEPDWLLQGVIDHRDELGMPRSARHSKTWDATEGRYITWAEWLAKTGQPDPLNEGA